MEQECLGREEKSSGFVECATLSTKVKIYRENRKERGEARKKAMLNVYTDQSRSSSFKAKRNPSLPIYVRDTGSFFLFKGNFISTRFK